MTILVEGKVAIVTGGAMGMGKSTAEILAEAGAKVMLTDIQEEQGEQVAAGIRATGGSAQFIQQDVTDEKQWSVVIQETIDKFNGFDVLVNNAGIYHAAWLEDVTYDDWRRVINVNLDSVFLGVREAKKAMRPGGSAGQGGSIINISSTAAMRGANANVPYCASKAGVHLLTQAAALECATHETGIRVNSVHPAVIETPMSDAAMKVWADLYTNGDVQEIRAASDSWHPLGHLGAPEDVANAVLYLASDASKFCTGTQLIVDGGYCARGM